MKVYSNSSCGVLLEKWSQLWGKTERQGKLGEQGTDHAYAPVVNLATVKRNQMCSQGTRETIMQITWFCRLLLIYPFRLLWAVYNSHCLSLRAILKPLQSAAHGPTPFSTLEILPLLYHFCTVHTQILNELDLTSVQQRYIKWLFSNSQIWKMGFNQWPLDLALPSGIKCLLSPSIAVLWL